VFHDLAENAHAFMSGVVRSLELQQSEANAVVASKRSLIDYLDRFPGDLVRRSDSIAQPILQLMPRIDFISPLVAERKARDAAPSNLQDQTDKQSQQLGGKHVAHSLRSACILHSGEPTLRA
jgi:hypothetical protein